MARIPIPKESIAEYCRNNHVRRFSLFGSVLREDFRPDSDVDVLVEFTPGHVPGFSGWRAWNGSFPGSSVGARWTCGPPRI